MNWQQGGEGAAGGAMTGAGIGSLFGPVGTGIGAGLGGIAGGLAGLFGGDPYEKYRNQLGAMGQAGIGPASLAGESDFRGNQQALVAMLEAQARGQGPSLAGQQLREAQDRGMKQASGLAASTQGPNAALAQFQAMNMAGANQAQAAQDAAAARIQEQYNAQNQLGLTLQGARGQDQALSMFNAGAMNDRDRANFELRMQALQGAGGMAGQPGIGDQLLAGGGGVLGFLMGQRGQQGSGGGMSPIAAGYPGAGGYWTPQGNAAGSYGGRPGFLSANSGGGYSQL